MTGHIRSLTQRARLFEFITSESGAMSAKRGAQIGTILGASALAGLLMSIPQLAHADPPPCAGHPSCPGGDPFETYCAQFGPGWRCQKFDCDTAGCGWRCAAAANC